MTRCPLAAALLLPLLALAPVQALASEDEAETKTKAPETRMAFTGDFVELGTGHPAVVRGSAAIEIVNRTPHPIDVKLGSGAGRIEKGRSLLVRMEAGAQPLEVSSAQVPGDRLKGVLELEKGKAYALGIAWERVRVEDEAVPAASGSAAEGKDRGEPAETAGTQTRSAGEKSEKGEVRPEKRKRSGRVDVGRKRKKDR